MSDTVIITTSGADRSNRILAREAHQLRLHGATLVDRLAHGTVATLPSAKVKELADAGIQLTHYRDTDRLEIAGRSIDIHAPTKGLSREELVPDDAAADWPFHVIQFVAPPFVEWRHAVEQLGIETVGRAGAYSVIVHSSSEPLALLAALPFVSMVSPLQPAWKVDPRLIGATGHEGSLSISLLSDNDAADVMDAVKKLRGRLIDKEVPSDGAGIRLIIEIDSSQALALAAHPAVLQVCWLAPATVGGEREVQILAENLDATVAPNTAPVAGYQAFLTNLAANGSGVTVAIADSGIDQGANNNATGHLDLRGRQAGYIDYTGVGTDQNGHGTHVTGIAVGNAATGTTEGAAPNNFLWGQGVAPNAQFFGQAMQSATNPTGSGLTVPAISTLCRDSVNNGATVQNDSWSSAPSPLSYTQRESDYDRAVRDADSTTTAAEPLTVVFAARNDGGLAQTIGDPASAKNVITVGNGLTRRTAVNYPDDDIRGIKGSSSRGPASGGRLKPDVLAPGTDVSSTMSSASANAVIPGGATYTYKSGTSMSAPHVTGACALLTHWWRNRTGGNTPSPAMLKALLVNGAEDMAGGSNWRSLVLNLVNAATGVYQLVGVGFAPTAVMVPNILLAQVASTVGMADRTWNFNAGTLTVRIVLAGQPAALKVDLLDAPIANIPNNDQGWGRVSLENIVFQAPTSDRGPRLFLDQRHAFTANGQTHTWRIQPADPTQPMRATLVWSDAPGAALSNAPLVNNLNLELSEASGTIWRGNNFANGFSTVGGAADAVNNVECIYLQSPTGVYTLTVRATTLTADARSATALTPWQDYALVLENAVFAAANPCAVSVLIDRSSSMITSGYVSVTRQASKQFIDLMNADDQVGVVSFGNGAQHEYHQSNQVVTIVSATEKNAAKTAVDNISFNGCTYMGQGLQFAQTQLTGASGNRAVVLLSDGKDNKGCDESNAAKPWAVDVAAAMPSSIDVYTCAMGPLSDQPVLQQIADLTGGRYYFMPTIDDLYEIYNFIRGNVTSTGVIVNTTSTASSSRVAAMVDCGAEQAVFACQWHDRSLRWVGRQAAKPNEISVVLRTPAGERVSAAASWVSRQHGDGYVIFTVDDPAPGRWHIEVQTARDEHTRYTVGGWVRSDVKLQWQLFPLPRELGRRALVQLDSKADLQVRYQATLSAPRISIPDLLRTLDKQLKRIKPDPDLIRNGVDPLLARLVAYDQKQLQAGRPSVLAPVSTRLAVKPVEQALSPRFELFKPIASVTHTPLRPTAFPIVRPLTQLLPAKPSSLYAVEIPARVAGSYTLRLHATAVDRTTGCRFERVAAESFFVHPRG